MNKNMISYQLVGKKSNIMNLEKSPYFKPNTYTQNARCSYCGLLNIASEKDIHVRYKNTKSNEIEWYIWCEACQKIIFLNTTIYTLVRERLVERKDSFQFIHKCGKTNVMTSIDRTQEKCGEHKNCWLYLCKKCFTMFHVNRIPEQVLKRLNSRPKQELNVLVEEKYEEIPEDTPLLSM